MLTREMEDQKARQLKELADELHIPVLEAFWALEVLDKGGKQIQKHEQRSHSFTRNAYNCLFTSLAMKAASDSAFGAGLLSLRDASGVVRFGPTTINPAGGDIDTGTISGYRVGAGVATQGIVVGSGIAAESFENFQLQTPIAEGIAAGQLNYVAINPHVITYIAATRTLRNELVRFMNNNSGGSVSINEVALIATLVNPGGTAISYCFVRDLLAATVVVPNTGQLRVTYVISLVYPA